MSSRTTVHRIILPFVAVAAAACGDDGTGPSAVQPPDTANVPPALGTITDPVVIRNTTLRDTVTVELDIHDPDDDSIAVTVESGSGIVRDTAFTCGADPCTWRFVPTTGTTAHVNVTVTVDDGSGGSAATGFVVHIIPRLVTTTESSGPGSLRQAISEARRGDVIGFDTDDVFVPPQTITLDAPLAFDRALTIEGPGADRLTVSGNMSVRVFSVGDGADVELLDLTVTEGRAMLQPAQLPDGTETYCAGGGVLVEPGGKLSLRRVGVHGNTALCGVPAADEPEDPPTENGGGVANVGGTLDIVDSDITGNESAFGGGISTIGAGVTSIETSTIANNDAVFGGGIMQNASTTTLLSSSVSSNTAALEGGGIVNAGTGFLQMTEGIVEHNRAFNGAGIYTHGTLRILDGPVIANEAKADGGGLYVSAGQVAVISSSCMILANVADVDKNGFGVGGGMYVHSRADIRKVPATRVCLNTPDDIHRQ